MRAKRFEREHKYTGNDFQKKSLGVLNEIAVWKKITNPAQIRKSHNPKSHITITPKLNPFGKISDPCCICKN